MNQTLLTTDFLQSLIKDAEKNSEGDVASYIPELENVNKEITAIAVQELGGQPVIASNTILTPITLQSTAKMIPLIGLLEECGPAQVFEWVKVEPSGDDFASITRLERFGPKPSNPMLNAGAIALCSQIPGEGQKAFDWLDFWVNRLFNHPLTVNNEVFKSEKRTGDRNRSLAYLLKTRKNLGAEVEETLDRYFSLCSYEATIDQLLYLPTLLANSGRDPFSGKQIISQETAHISVAIMATCGLYDETGTHMVRTGMPAKSGVSGYILALVPGKASIVVLSPRVNSKGNSIRGELLLEGLSKKMQWHFAGNF
jgi:glutaminase